MELTSKRRCTKFGRRGDWAFDVQEKYLDIRYQLLPYIYSTTCNVTQHASSFLRLLAAAFPIDKAKFHNSNAFLFGQSFWVTPVTDKGVKEWPVYLSAGSNWYDFLTGKAITGGTTIKKATPADILPLYVKAGSIIPWGPKVLYAAEKKWDNLEICIYPGPDADFTLYENEGDSYNYEKGEYAEIRFHWNDVGKKLMISSRNGSFPGMLSKQKIRPCAG